MKPFSKISRTAGAAVRAALFLCTILILSKGCSPAGQKSASDAGKEVVKIAEELCVEESSQTSDPDLVALACKTAGGIVRVLMPRPAWRGMRRPDAGTLDAGPGK